MELTKDAVELVADNMMVMALDNLVRDGYVAFACLIISRGGTMTPIMLEVVDADSKRKLGDMLRVLAAHCAAIVIISEAWTYDSSKHVAEHANKNESVFVTVASKEGDLTISTTFERDGSGKPVRPSRLTRTWQPKEGVVMTNFQGLFASA